MLLKTLAGYHHNLAGIRDLRLPLALHDERKTMLVLFVYLGTKNYVIYSIESSLATPIYLYVPREQKS